MSVKAGQPQALRVLIRALQEPSGREGTVTVALSAALREVLDDANLVGYHLDIGESPLAGQADVHRLAGVQVPVLLTLGGILPDDQGGRGSAAA